MAESAVIEEETIPWNDLLERAKAGQTQARDKLCRELSVNLALVAQYRLWGWSPQDREDVVQDCLCTLLQKLDRIKSNPHKYAYRILRNKIGDVIKRRHVTMIPIQDEDADGASAPRGVILQADPPDQSRLDPAVWTEERDQSAIIRDAIMSLSSFCRTCLLGMLENRKLSELWASFRQIEPGLGRHAFYKRVFDCRRRLKHLLQTEITG